MNNKYSESIMSYVRQNLYLKPDDASRDTEINSMSKDEILDRVCNWNGLIHYGSTIKSWVEDIYKIELKE